MVAENYPCYVRICEATDSDDIVELPTETDGTMLLSTITAQYPEAIGLRFKSDSGVWRGVRVTNNVLDIPLEGWGEKDYYVTVAKTGEKRKADSESGPKNKKEMLQDLIVLGLPYTSTEDDLKEYFLQYGELAHWEIKIDKLSNKSKGFGFVRFTDPEVVEQVLRESHNIGGRDCEVRFPRKEPHHFNGPHDGEPTKLFIGRLPRGATTEDLRECFSQFGPLKDVYIPSNFRGFGFVTFPSESAAFAAMNCHHTLKGSQLNVTHPSPKPGEGPTNLSIQMQQQQQSFGYDGPMQGRHMQGNMQGSMQGSMAGNMQVNMNRKMQGHMQQMPQNSVGWYNSQSNKSNSGYYSKSYSPSSGKIN